MWFKLALLFIFYGTVSTQETSNHREVIPEFCEAVITSNRSVDFVIPSNRTTSPENLEVRLAEGFEGCFRRYGLTRTDRRFCSYPFYDCVCSYTNNEWNFYSCGYCSRRDTKLFFDTCVLFSPRPPAERSQQGGSSALLGWFVMVVIVFALSCCCRLFRNQICCDCCYDNMYSSRSFAITEINVARASVPSTDDEEEEDSSSQKPLTAVPMDQVVVVYNPDEEDINVGVQKES